MLFGLRKLAHYAKFNEEDILLFTYLGSGEFTINVFDHAKVEKEVEDDAIIREINEEDIIHNVENASNVNVPEEHIIVQINEPVPNVFQFSRVMRRSHVNNSGHGVYIPKYIQPEAHEWAA
ncbi:uncharacterized protein LOC141702115 [Apium graveolens]|uniref:uncharacterized protein LOC141702115 n=1 Tax=Apium graveolens TaxID=4045 RepID=UPI003D7A89A5